MSSALRPALLCAATLCALGLTFALQPLALPLPDPGWFGLPTGAAVLAGLRALAGLALLNLAALGLGGAALRWLPAARLPRACAAAQLGLGFAALSLIVLGMAASHLLHAWALGGLLAACSAAALWPAMVRGHEHWQRLRSSLRQHRWLGLPGIALLAAPALAAFGPDPGWDALTYHLAVPERYLFANAIVVTPYSVFSTFPHATGMLYLLALQLDGAALAQWLHLEFGVLTAWVAWSCARDVSARAGWLTLAALAACPLFMWELGVAYADLSAAFYTVLAVRLLRDIRPADAGRGLVAAGLFAGSAAACRYPSWPLLPVLLLCLWLPGSGVAPGASARARASLAFGLAACAPLVPWLLRNALFTGNPVAPLLQPAFAASPEGGYFAAVALEQNASLLRAIGMGRGPLDLLALPWNLSFAARPGDYTAFGFRVGVLYVLGVVAALLAGRRHTALRAGALWWPAGLLTLVWFFSAQEPRYLLPALVLIAIGGACAADALIPAGARGRPWLALPLLAVAHTQLPLLASLPERYGIAAGRVEAASPAPARMARWLQRETQGETQGETRTVLFFEPRALYFAGLDYVPYHLGNGSPLLIELHAAAQADALPAFFQELETTHVLLETRLEPITTPRFVPGYTRANFTNDVHDLEQFLANHATAVHREDSLVLYRLGRESR